MKDKIIKQECVKIYDMLKKNNYTDESIIKEMVKYHSKDTLKIFNNIIVSNGIADKQLLEVLNSL